MSVATTEFARRRACRAWMPHPVPRSSTRPVALGNCRPLSVTDAPPTPSTWSGRSGAAGRELSQIARDPPGAGAARVGEGVRPQIDERGDAIARLPRGARVRSHPRSTRLGRARSAAGAIDVHPEHEQAGQGRGGVIGVGERPQRGDPIPAAERGLGGCAPQPIETVDGEPRRGQIGTKTIDERGIHRTIEPRRPCGRRWLSPR